MAFNGNSSTNFGMAAYGKASVLQVRRSSATTSAIPAFGPTLPGTGFETLPPLAISTSLFQFLKCLGLDSVGLSLDCVPFHAGWELVVWKPYLGVSVSEIVEISEEIEVEDSIEDFGPQIELNLENPENFGEPLVEVAGVAPTEVVEVEEKDSSVEFLISEKEMKRDQAERTGAEPVPEAAQLKREGQTVGTGEPVLEVDRSGEEPDLMEVNQAVRIGFVPVREVMKERTGG